MFSLKVGRKGLTEAKIRLSRTQGRPTRIPRTPYPLAVDRLEAPPDLLFPADRIVVGI